MVSIETYSLYCLIYLIPGCIFYLIFAFHLFTKKEFKTPFFGILKILVFVDFAALLFSCICMRSGHLLSQVSFLYTPRMGSTAAQPHQQLTGPSLQPVGPSGPFIPPGPQGPLSSVGPQGPNFQPPLGSQGPVQPPGPLAGQLSPPGPPPQTPQGNPKPQQSFQPPEPHGILFRQPNEPYNVITTLLNYFMSVFGGVQACLHVILAFNRLTAILFPHQYRTLWRGKSLYGCISTAFIIPSIMYCWILYYGANVLMSPVFGSMVTPIPWLHKATINTIIISITCVMAFAFDLSTFILLQKRKMNKTDSSKYHRDLRLLTVSVAFLIVHTLYLATAVYVLLSPIKDGMFLLIFLQTTIEIQSLISPFCVLVVNQNLRRDMFRRNSKSATVLIQGCNCPTF